MIVFLYGPDAYRRQKKSAAIADKYQKIHSAKEKFDLSGFSDDEFVRLKGFVSNYSIFEQTKLAVLENVFEREFLEKNEKELAALLKANVENKDLVLLISEERKPAGAKFAFLLKPPVLFQEFENLSGAKLSAFIRKEAEARGVKLAAEAVSFLAEIFYGDGWGLINELEKISLLNKKDFNVNDARNAFSAYKPLNNQDFFYLAGGFFSNSPVYRKIANLEILLSREEPAKIFNILAASHGNSPAALRRFADYDAAIKSGKFDYAEALFDLILAQS